MESGVFIVLFMFLAMTHCYWFEEGYHHHYTYSSTTNTLGMYNVTVVIKFRIRNVNRTDNGASLHQLHFDAVTMRTQDGYFFDNPKKWDLTKSFLFEIEQSGLIQFVHVHPDDEFELMTMKKALTGTLSANYKVENKDTWEYKSTEIDHGGKLSHNYRGLKTRTGVVLHKQHRSSDEIHRQHDRTIHYNNEGLIHYVHATDNLTTHNVKDEDDFYKTLHSEKAPEKTGAFPTINAFAESQVRLTSKQKFPKNYPDRRSFEGLRRDETTLRPKPATRIPLSTIENEIQRLTKCVLSHNETNHPNRIQCLHYLRHNISGLKSEDFKDLMKRILSVNCSTEDHFCQKEKHMMIGILVHSERENSQQMINRLIFKNPKSTEEEVRQCLVHCIHLHNPDIELIDTIEGICFGKHMESVKEMTVMNEIQKGACLTIGALAKALRDEGRLNEAKRITSKLEDWLRYHNESEFQEIYRPREKRSLDRSYEREDNHARIKRTLIHALGNAAHPDSLPYLQSYMKHDEGMPSLRRAASHALRHYTCQESASSLLRASLYDPEDVVRHTSFDVYSRHPQRKTLTKDQEDMILERKYTYPVISRIRKRSAENLLQENEFDVKLSQYNWGKNQGSGNIGSSSGMDSDQSAKFHMTEVESIVTLKADKQTHSKANAGFAKKRFDNHRTKICDKKSYHYDLNVLNDYGFKDAQDIMTEYDKAQRRIIRPIKEAVKGLNDLIFGPSTENKLRKSINDISEDLQQCQQSILRINDEITKDLSTIIKFNVNQAVKKSFDVILETKSFVQDVKSDVELFHEEVIHSVNTTLSLIYENMKQLFLGLEKSWNFFEDPLASFQKIEIEVLRLRESVSDLIQVQTNVEESMYSTNEQHPTWILNEKDFDAIIELLKSDHLFLKGWSSNEKTKVYHNITEVIGQTMQITVSKLLNFKSKAKDFFSKLHELFHFTREAKVRFLSLSDSVQMGRFQTQSIFGTKFHGGFPRKIASCREGCGCGVFDERNRSRGIDLLVDQPDNIVVIPVSGIAYLVTNNTIAIMPESNSMQMYTIFISNVQFLNNRLSDKVGTIFKAGTYLAQPNMRSDCEPFISIAVQERNILEDKYNEYRYIDPSVFLLKRFPIPKWKQHCNDFTLEQKGHVAQEGDASAHPTSEDSKVAREGVRDSITKDIHGKKWDNITVIRSGNVNNKPPETERLLNNLFELLSRDDMNLNFSDIENLTLPELLGILPQNEETEFLDTLTSLLAHKMKEDQQAFRNDSLFSIMTRSQKVEFIERHLKSIEKRCPTLLDSFTHATDIVCKTHIDCNGLTCRVALLNEVQMFETRLSYRFNATSGIFTLNVNDEHVIEKDSGAYALTVQFNDSYHAIFMISIMKEENVSKLSISGQLCIESEFECYEELILFKDLQHSKLENQDIIHRQRREAESGDQDGLDSKYSYSTNYSALYQILKKGGTFQEFMNELLDSSEITQTTTLYEFPPAQEVSSSVEGKADRSIFKKFTDAYKAKWKFYNSKKGMQLQTQWDNSEKTDNAGDDKSKSDEENIKDSETLKKAKFSASATLSLTFSLHDVCAGAAVGGSYDYPVFMLRLWYPCGPILFSMRLGADASIGFSADTKSCLYSKYWRIGATAFLGGVAYGEFGIDILIAFGGIRIEGRILQISLDISNTLTWNKPPVTLIFSVDLNIVPLELRLSAVAYIRFFFVEKRIFDQNIWSIKFFPFHANLIKVIKQKGKPAIIEKPSSEFSYYKTKLLRKRSINDGCSVQQVNGRDPTDPAFLLSTELAASLGELSLSYSVGTTPGGTDVLPWSKMTKPVLLAPLKLPSGIPLYWSVKGVTTDGNSMVRSCSLSTYDNTVPSGRIDVLYPYTSHPKRIAATIIVFDDSPLKENHTYAIGLAPGYKGNQVLDWSVFNFTKVVKHFDNIESFSRGKDGKLSVTPMKSLKTKDHEECALVCVNTGEKCISFDYEFHSETCDVHEVIEGPSADLKVSGTYKHFERIGVGNTHNFEYSFDLLHGERYYINAEVTNSLMYKSLLSSKGTIVDFTPPEPHFIGNASQDELFADKCHASILQSCEEVTWRQNHRKIVDGKDAATVYNGHHPEKETKFTLTNHFASANWRPFTDKESGISGYTWAFGTSVCRTDISDFKNPHQHLSDKRFWTYTGYARDIHLPDGKYYTTVQAINNVIHGGSLVTTVCHSTPIVVDTTPPLFKGVSDILFDEDFNIMAIYFEAEDKESFLSRIDFGLGKTKHDVEVRGYSEISYPKRENPYILITDLNITDGEPAWIRLRAVNNVELSKAGHSDDPILIDRTNPIAGEVLDGNTIGQDQTYQPENNRICASWKGFYDPESGIEEYHWGVGTFPGLDDIVAMETLSRSTKNKCSFANLAHNTTYYSVIEAKNSALNSKTIKQSSNGVLVDMTEPNAGWVNDGDDPEKDQNFSSESALISARWGNFSDEESEINHYVVDVFVNDVKARTFDVGIKKALDDFSMSFAQGDRIYSLVTAYNGAGLSVKMKSSGFIIDLTPPNLKYIHDTKNGLSYQSDSQSLSYAWKFLDPESGIKQYRLTVFEMHQGMKIKFYPTNEDFICTNAENITLSGLSLQNGRKYLVKIVAFNNADMPVSHESEGVIIDTSAPVISQVHIGLPGVEEEEEDGKVMHADQSAMTVSWRAADYQSGIVKAWVAIGLNTNDTSITNGFKEFEDGNVARLSDLSLTPSSISDTEIQYYYVMVKVMNGAGLLSLQANSKPVYVMKSNVPGTVFDGREALSDEDFTYDRTSLAMSFNGFESEACNLIQYEWAIGYKPFTYDVLPFTDYGIVMHNQTFGQAQIHVSLYEGSTYFITVRAKTGFNCPMGEYVISCSDGIKLDTTKPQIGMSYEENTITPNSMPLYQTSMDSVNLKWKIKDSSKISESWWSIGSLPKQEDVSKKINTMDNFIPSGFLKLSHGQTFYVNVGAKDKAGNEMITSSPPITIDTTPPEIHNFTCTPFISLRKSLVVCTWAMIEEWESVLANTAIGIGRNETYPDISEFHTFSKLTRSWTRDLRLRLKNDNFAHIHIIVKMQNLAGLETYKSFKIVVDSTPPSGGIVQIVTTTAATNASRNVQRCQIPQTYLEARVASWGDAESGIDRYQVAVGCGGKSTNILKFSNWIINDVILIPNLDMITGSRVVVTVRAFNKAGLYGQVKSDPVIISPNPKLYVYDGPTEIDIDYQKSLSSIEGNWRYSDNCHIESVEWGVESIDGKVIQKFQPVPSALHHFYSDLIDLQNGVTYINIIRTIDALGRVRESRSNGLAVKIQPPTPATVRDGSDDDLDYQESTNELQINWDSFGKPNCKDPTERIVRYEVALGNDVRFEETRSNVHYFLDAGLSNNYVFKGLNLTSKTVTYYATVRAYSQAGSFQDGISDGIKVGFREVLTEGNIEYNAAQYMTDKISVSWSGFEADMGIDHFEVGISSRPPLYPNGTHDCYTFRDFDEVFNTKKMEGVGKDTFKDLKQLSLLHGHSYFVTVIAADVTGKCVGSTGKAVIIDTSPPEKGNVTIRGKYSDNIVYIKHYDQITIEWNGFQDNESGILEYEIKLYSSTTCYDDGSDPEKNTDIHTPEKAVTVKTENKITFYELSLKQFKTYIVKVTAKSKAGLQTSSLSEYIKCDTTPPTKGTVKVGDSWFKEAAFQPFTDKLNGTIALAHSEMAYQCQSQRPLDAQNELEPMKGRFRTECVITSDSKVKIEIRHDDNLRGIIKGGVKSIKKEIIAGNYSSKLTTARGKQMVTSIFLATGSQFVKEELDFQVKENQTDIDYDLNNTLSDSFSNITNFETSNMEMLNDSKMLNKSTVNSGMSKNINHTSNVEKSSVLGLNDIFGIGFHIPGYTKDKQWFVFVWVFDQYISTSRQIPIDFDPTVSNVEYTIQLTNSTFVGKNVWNVKYFIQSEQIAEFNGLRFEEYGTFGVYNWNENEYVPPIENIDFPVAFEASSTIEIMKEPIPADKPCMFGSSFFEKDSFIQEFWVKVSEYENETDTSFDDYLLYASFCQKCAENCNIGCRQDCKPSMTEFEILQFTIENLNLTASKMSGDRTNGSAVQYDSTTYFIHTLIVNSAGITTHSASKGVIIDNTPPEFNYVRCVDPLSSTEEPSLYQGSNDSLRAYWDCKEDVGQIVDYKIDAGTSPENNDILSDLPVGKGRKFLYSNLKTPLEHGKTYYITVRAVNSAGMVGKGSCNITVELSPPNVENLIVQNMFTQDDEETFDVSLSTNEIGLQWQNGTNDVEFYEWQIGSEKDTDDIFPRIKVGLADSKKASIQNGELLIDDISLNATVGVFASKNKTNQKDVPNQSFFNMEPGLCLHIKLFAVGRSHLSSSVNPKPTCVIRDKDEQIDFTKTTKETLKDPVTLMPALSITGKDNIILAGMLSKSDVMRDYGTAASDRYKRYIVDPTDTQNNTERILQKRFIGNTEHMFYLSPITNIETKFILDLPFNHHKYDVNQERPLLIFWNKENEKWEDVETNCETSSVIDYQTGTMTIEVCGDIFLVDKRHEGRQKRSTAEKGIMQSPRMFALRKVSKTVPNNPPFITTTEMQYKEDKTSSELIKMGDPENDSLSIRLTMPPKHGSANLTSNGVLTYLSHRDFYGDDVITVRVREVNVTSPLTPLEIEKNITIRVLPQNDEPILSFKQRYHEMKCTKNNITLEVLLNGNETRHIFYGILILDDIDSNNTVHLGTMHNNTPNNHFLLEQQRHNVASYGHNGVHREYSIKQDIHKSFSGIAEFAARAHDEFDGGKVSFSKEFRISTYILINPCIHGICANKSNVPCKDKSRAFSFENFRCDCYPGYRGDWCQVDINECVPNPCSVFYDCNNLIGRYECILNGPKSFGLAIGFTVIVATLVLLIRRCIQKRPLNNKIAPINIWDENMTRENSEPKDFPLDTLTAELSTAQPANSVATETKNKRLFFKRLGTKGHEVKGGSGSLHEIENDQDFNIDENQLSRRTVLSEEQIQAMLTPLSYYSSAVGKSLPPHLQRGRMEERMSHDGPKSSQA